MTDSILTILPEIGLLVLIALVLIIEIIWKEKAHRVFGWVTMLGALVVILLSILFSQPGENQLIFGNMLSFDRTGFVFRLIFLTGVAVTALLAMDDPSLGSRGEFYILLMISALGMSLMASSSDLIMLYLAIETTSIPLYVLAGFIIQDKKSVEAGLKYLLFGAMTSAIMLYGFGLLYGFTGTTQIYQIASIIADGNIPAISIATVVVLILVGFGFKISAVPFHFWAPDVYEGAPSPVAGFLSTASKAAGFAVLIRVMLGAFVEYAQLWSLFIAILATASMFVGNFLALAQKNIKRLLAYSSIAQAGTMLIGIAAGTELGITGTIYYLIAYLVTNLAAFGVVTIVGRTVGSDQISAYAGLNRRSPGLALALLAAMLSLAGIPPFAGFFGKLLVLAAAVESKMVWLAFVGAINSIISLFYYLSVLKVVYLYRSEEEEKPILMTPAWTIVVIACVAGIILLGTIFGPWFDLSESAALAALLPW